MANQFATCNIIAKESLAIIENMLGFAKNVNRKYETEYTSNQARGYSPGQTINIKKPPRYTYRAGRVANPQATAEPTVPLTINQGGADLHFLGIERTVSIQEMSKKIQAAMAPVTNEIDRAVAVLAHQSVYNCIGTPGTLPNTQALALAAATGLNQRLDEMAAPRDTNRSLGMNPAFNASMIQGLAGLFNAQSNIAEQYKKGMFVDGLGLNVFMDQNVDIHTNGTQAVTGTNVNGAGQTGSSITIVATTGTITRGTKLTLPGVFAVNPQSRVTTGTLAQFVVTTDVASGATTLPISPAIVTSGAFQNVTASPTTGSPYVIFGTASGSFACNVAYHEDAFTLAMVPMYAPPSGKGVIDVATQSYNGMNLKVTEFYDGMNDDYIIRIDVLWGVAATYPELACIYGV